MKISIAIFPLLTFLLTISLSCGEQATETSQNLSEEETASYLKKGQSIASGTFTVLSGKLQSALKENGVQGALEYCKLTAFPIVDSLSEAHNAEIRRTSLKVRNPQDAPDEIEKTILDKFHKMELKGESIKPIVQREGENVAFYAPIRILPLCTQCHGEVGEGLTQENNNFIQSLYPEDKAIGYAENDLRGIWSIRFSN
ncbi:MAG: DUF3365 domain-containing protein [Bacteroidetes bacterium]|nr:DUF3365 domain-containing protein [Bacteroidota bacterium]